MPVGNYTMQQDEAEIKTTLSRMLRESSISDLELGLNLPLYLSRQMLMHVLFMDEIYQHAMQVHGVILEFGVRWGRNMALLTALRGTYEPFNYNRRIIGFDSFKGFPSVTNADGKHVAAGQFSVSDDHYDVLTEILELHERAAPLSHIKKFELVRGDASKTVPAYLEAHPETIVSLA